MVTPGGYETLYKGVGDRRLERVLAIVVELGDLLHRCAGTVRTLTAREIHVEIVALIAPGDARQEEQIAELGVTEVTNLGHRPLALPAEPELRGALVAQIRRSRPDVVIAPDPTPMLRHHPDQRLLARAALDAAWPYAGAELGSELGVAHQPREAWLFGGPAPDLFVVLDDGREETFAQVDFRDR